jgi:hypothetical protein
LELTRELGPATERADDLRLCGKLCSEINLRLADKLLTDMLRDFDDGKIPNKARFDGSMEELAERIADEMSLHLLLFVPPERAGYYENKCHFGMDVADKFPSAISDVEEAGKCLALGRGTACVFHLMRVMEIGLKALAKGLDIPYAPSWESYLKQIEIKITGKHGNKSKRWKTEEPFYRDSSGDLQMVKIAWRNPTMHIVRSYTPEEAEDVFRAVRTFMQRVASRFTETGRIKLPKAKLKRQ